MESSPWWMGPFTGSNRSRSPWIKSDSGGLSLGKKPLSLLRLSSSSSYSKRSRGESLHENCCTAAVEVNSLSSFFIDCQKPIWGFLLGFFLLSTHRSFSALFWLCVCLMFNVPYLLTGLSEMSTNIGGEARLNCLRKGQNFEWTARKTYSPRLSFYLHHSHHLPLITSSFKAAPFFHLLPTKLSKVLEPLVMGEGFFLIPLHLNPIHLQRLPQQEFWA